jgi:hypothetical protein
MDSWGARQRWQYGTLQAVGFGFVAGALEAVNLAASSLLALSWLQALIVGVLAVLLMGVVGGVLGALAGAPVQGLHRESTRVSTTLSRHLAGAAFLLTGFYLWQMAYRLAEEGAEPAGYLALVAMPLGFAGVAFFNARFWLRKAELGREAALGWLPVSLLGSLVVVLGASLTWALRDPGTGYALEGDPSLVLVTVDGLRHDDVLEGEAVAGFEELQAEGVVFANAVSPSGNTRSALASVLVGLHPLRHRVLSPDDFLSRGYTSLAEALADQGWATAGFVSSPVAAAGSGLEQGFRVYDDDLLPGPAGLGRLLLVQDLLRVGRVLGMPEPWRDAGSTAERAAAWVRAHGDQPFFVWVHLTDPVMRADDADAVRQAGWALQTLREAVDEAAAGDVMWAVAGSHGELRGAHGGQGSVGLYDEVVHVPLVLSWPEGHDDVQPVEAQVRLMDLATTLAVAMGLDELDDTEGVELSGYADGVRQATISTTLVGPDGDGGWLLGLRNNGLKVIRAADGTDRLYDLGDDPAEAHDLAAEQPKALLRAQQLLAPDQIALDKLVD